jgi:hypothetical protein
MSNSDNNIKRDLIKYQLELISQAHNLNNHLDKLENNTFSIHTGQETMTLAHRFIDFICKPDNLFAFKYSKVCRKLVMSIFKELCNPHKNLAEIMWNSHEELCDVITLARQIISEVKFVRYINITDDDLIIYNNEL